MSTITIKKLFTEYTQQRKVKVNEEQFTSFTVFFPALLVIISDGIVDMEEWEYVKQLSRFIAKSFKEEDHQVVDIEELAKAYRHEISFLIKHLRDWQDKFIEALQNYITENPEVKSSVLDTMELFAEASEGTSDEEEKRIKYLIEKLDLN
jgi:hypothetical protein